MLVYLIHFERKIHHAQHYVGCTDHLRERLITHAHGDGARILEVCRDKKIEWRLAAVWSGTYKLERELKIRKNAPLYCPSCTPTAAQFYKLDRFPVELITFPIDSITLRKIIE